MNRFRGVFLVLLGLASSATFAGGIPGGSADPWNKGSYSIDRAATGGAFTSSVPGDYGSMAYEGTVVSTPDDLNGFSGAQAGVNQTGSNGSNDYRFDGFAVNSAFSFCSEQSESFFSVRGGIIANDILDFTVGPTNVGSAGFSRFFINGVEIANPSGGPFQGRLNVGDRLGIEVYGTVTGPGISSGNRALNVDICAVPEPASIAALGAGAALLIRRRRQTR